MAVLRARAQLALALLVLAGFAMPQNWFMSPFRRQPRPGRWYYRCPRCGDVRDFARRQKKTPHCRRDGAFMTLITGAGR
jgi:hypothetical protein